VQIVGPGFERDVDDAPARPSVLGVVGVGLDLELFHRVHRGREVVAAARAVGRAVEEEFVRGEAPAVEGPGGAALVVEGAQARRAGGPEGRHLPVHSSGQAVQHEDHAAVEGHVLHHFAIDDLAEAAAGGIEQGGLPRDLDRLAHAAELELDVQGRVLADGQPDPRLDELAETLHLRLDAIGAWDQESRGVDAVGLGHGLPADAGAFVGDGDGDSGKGASRGIGDPAEYGAAKLLGGGEGRGSQEGQDARRDAGTPRRSDHERNHAHLLGLRPWFNCLNR
jgi:hypothetical protein